MSPTLRRSKSPFLWILHGTHLQMTYHQSLFPLASLSNGSGTCTTTLPNTAQNMYEILSVPNLLLFPCHPTLPLLLSVCHRLNFTHQQWQVPAPQGLHFHPFHQTVLEFAASVKLLGTTLVHVESKFYINKLYIPQYSSFHYANIISNSLNC